MNKKSKSTTDFSTPYRTLSFTKVAAPVKSQSSVKCRVITSGNDLRSKAGK